jgi:hypothetical protein
MLRPPPLELVEHGGASDGACGHSSTRVHSRCSGGLPGGAVARAVSKPMAAAACTALSSVISSTRSIPAAAPPRGHLLSLCSIPSQAAAHAFFNFLALSSLSSEPLLFPPNKQASAHSLPAPDATQSRSKKSPLPTPLPRSRSSASAVPGAGAPLQQGAPTPSLGSRSEQERRRKKKVKWPHLSGILGRFIGGLLQSLFQ